MNIYQVRNDDRTGRQKRNKLNQNTNDHDRDQHRWEKESSATPHHNVAGDGDGNAFAEHYHNMWQKVRIIWTHIYDNFATCPTARSRHSRQYGAGC